MTKERAWPVRVMYILIAAALAMGLMITMAPAQKVSANPGLSEWTRVETPTVDGWVVAPESDIIDFAVAEGGDVAYAVVYAHDEACVNGTFNGWASRLLKSEDGAATWDDIADSDWAGNYSPLAVATDGVDADFVAVALSFNGTVYVSVSSNGGDTFTDPKLVGSLTSVYDFAVSPEVSEKREIAIGGGALLYRSTFSGGSLGDWKNATTEYEGWLAGTVVEIKFSPSWATDKTVLVVTANTTDVYLQFGSWGTTSGWNDHSTLAIGPVAMPKISGVNPAITLNGLVAGIALPSDYNSKTAAGRLLWVWVNYANYQSRIVRVENDEAYFLENLGQIKQGNVWLTNISYWGTIDEGKAMASVLGDGAGSYTQGCTGVQVYRKEPIKDMQICCETWKKACKLPTGIWAMEVAYVSADKAYAVALGPMQSYYDESAWSVSFDDGNVWNQLSLIDTFIHYFSDVAVSPDCNKTFLVSISKVEVDYCDSVWVHADTFPEAGYDEYSGHWLRTWSGELEGDEGFDAVGALQDRYMYEWGLLRLAPEETDGTNVFLVDYGTSNVYWNDLETLGCWTPIGSTVIDHIVDLAAQDKDTLFALDANGDVAMFDVDEWQEEVASKVGYGYTIAVWGAANATHVLVGGEDGDVSYSDDGGETFALLETTATIDGYVTVAFDTYFDTNKVVYAATEEDDYTGGIYKWVIGESTKWMDLKAEPKEWQVLPESMWTTAEGDAELEVAFTGLVVDRPGNPFTSPENGGVIYASYYGYYKGYWFTGAARSLERTVTVCTTCLDWDFLHEGLTFDVEGFEATPDALKICGCLTPDSNTKLFAIDEWWDYDMCEGQEGAVWTYEDCYAKKAPEISSPADGTVIPADPCSCYSAPFTITWDAICDACSFDIAFAMDEDFTMPVSVNKETGTVYHIVSDTPSFSIMGGPDGGLSCETTYYVRIRAADAATGEIIHSWWSDPIEITIAPSVEAGIISLVSPAPGALNQPTKNVGFSWDLMADADSFDWVLDDSADLSSPLDSKTGLTSKATTYGNTLSYGTTYYWQVKAYQEGALIGTSSVGTFTTAPTGAFCCPVDGLCFATEAELEAHNADAHGAAGTPFWVWVVIAIGAVLVIVVIVLIFRTRRV